MAALPFFRRHGTAAGGIYCKCHADNGVLTKGRALLSGRFYFRGELHMCAIAGFADFRKNLEGEKAVLEAMTQTMTHRGPDAAGFWVCGHVALGHRRLRWWTRTAGRSP